MKQGVIPSIFDWNSKSDEEIEADCITDNYLKESKKCSAPTNFFTNEDALTENLQSSIFDNNVDYQEVIIDTTDKLVTPTHENQEFHDDDDDDDNNPATVFKVLKQRYSIEEFKKNPAAVLEFTGLEDYYKFETVFLSLGKDIKLNYQSSVGYGKLSLKDQFFLTLWKLRKYPTDMELSLHFGIHKKQVGNIFITWLNFMSKQWSKINSWPSKELVQYYMPPKFKAQYPDTRVIIDGTEIHVESSSNPED